MKADAASAARGVIRVVNANMERAIRVITVERGFDPRGFALLAFGHLFGFVGVLVALPLAAVGLVAGRRITAAYLGSALYRE